MCVFGSSLSPSAGYEDLQAAYGVFEQEVAEHAPDYRPETVTTDGWEATRRAWETLFRDCLDKVELGLVQHRDHALTP